MRSARPVGQAIERVVHGYSADSLSLSFETRPDCQAQAYLLQACSFTETKFLYSECNNA